MQHFICLSFASADKVYSKAWEAFKDFAKFSGQPSKEDYGLYFDHLRTEKGWKASTIWSTYFKLNDSHK